ncbi:MAG: hypothetical protein R6V19_09735 [Armatimonadota bacterium]
MEKKNGDLPLIRPWLFVAALAVVVAIAWAFLWFYVHFFLPASVDLDTVEALTRLSFPDDAKLQNSHYVRLPYRLLVAKITMSAEDLETFRANVPAEEWVPKVFAGGPVLPWYDPGTLDDYETGPYSLSINGGKPRIVDVMVPREPTGTATVYIWSIVD